jgi:hypothetical protein
VKRSLSPLPRQNASLTFRLLDFIKAARASALALPPSFLSTIGAIIA